MIKSYAEEFIKENYPFGKDFYLDSDYELSNEIVGNILESKSLEEINTIVDETIEELDYLNFDVHFSEVFEEFCDSLDDKEEFVYDKEDARDSLQELFYLNIDRNIILNKEVRANIYPLNSLNERLYFSLPSNLEDINLGNVELNSYEGNLLEAMKLIKVNPYEVGEILKKRGEIVINNFPKNLYENPFDAKEFISGVENSAYGGDLVFTSSISLQKYISNFEIIKQRGLLIEKGTAIGFHDSMNGSGDLFSERVNEDIVLENFEIEDDRNINYGIDSIFGVVESYYWGASKLSFAKTSEEKSILEKLESLSNNPNIKLYNTIKEEPLKIMCSFVTSLKNSLKDTPFTPSLLNIKLFEEQYSKFHWIQEKPELLAQTMEYITKLSDNLQTASIEELNQIINKYNYTRDDYESPLQKSVIAIKNLSFNIAEFGLEKNLSNLLLKEKNSDNLPSIIEKEFGYLNSLFNGDVKDDMRFSEKEKEIFETFTNTVKGLIENKQLLALKQVQNGSLNVKEISNIASEIVTLCERENEQLDAFLNKRGIDTPEKQEISQEKRTRKNR